MTLEQIDEAIAALADAKEKRDLWKSMASRADILVPRYSSRESGDPMETALTAPFDGVVENLSAAVGDQVVDALGAVGK